MINGPQQ
jgi:hypothetical protein